MSGILTGLRIVEGSAFVAAPSAGMTLAQLGAEVIRFDPIGGGLDRQRWPVAANGNSLYWAGLNKHKKSIAIDIRSPAGREVAQALITASGDGAGLFLTNFPAAGWLDYDGLKARRDDLIMVTIKGNRDGSSEVDYTVNCATGLPYMTGPVGHGDPVNHVLPAWDLICGQSAALGLLAAERKRRESGQGQKVEIALSDVAFAAMGALGFVGEAIVNAEERSASGNDLFGAFGRDFVSRDGKRLMIVAITARQWRALVEASGLAARFALIEQAFEVDLGNEGERYQARAPLAALIERWVAARDYDDVTAALDAAGAAWGPYRSLRAALDEDPRLAADGPLFQDLEQPGLGRYRVPATPLDFSASARVPPAPAPSLGQHTDEVLASCLGLDGAAIARLHDAGTVA